MEKRKETDAKNKINEVNLCTAMEKSIKIKK